MPTIHPQPIPDHPLPQCLDAQAQAVPCRQLLHRERRAEIAIVLAKAERFSSVYNRQTVAILNLGTQDREGDMKWAVAAMAICITFPAFAQLAPSPHAVKFEDIKWEPLEGGGEISILYTNPVSKATYLVIRAEKNAHVPRHWHTATRHSLS